MNNVNPLIGKQKMCPMISMLVVDPKTNIPHYLGGDENFCKTSCRFYNQIAQKCEFLVSFDRMRKLDTAVLSIEQKLKKLEKEKDNG